MEFRQYVKAQNKTVEVTKVQVLNERLQRCNTTITSQEKEIKRLKLQLEVTEKDIVNKLKKTISSQEIEINEYKATMESSDKVHKVHIEKIEYT